MTITGKAILVTRKDGTQFLSCTRAPYDTEGGGEILYKMGTLVAHAGAVKSARIVDVEITVKE